MAGRTHTKTARPTPGPWSADKWATGWTVSAPDSHYSVCHLEGCNNADANARLIAAAPDLLAALEKAADYMGEMGYPEDILEHARAALAKAGA